MSLKIEYSMGERAVLEFENILSSWNILKYNIDTPYLRQYIVTDYDGGNTAVSPEEWVTEGVLFQELSKGVYSFPYESIGFIMNDTLESIRFYVLNNDCDPRSYENNYELAYSVSDTDMAKLVVKKENTVLMISLYLIAQSKIGMDGQILSSIQNIVKGICNPKVTEVEFVENSTVVGVNGFSFVAAFYEGSDKKPKYYKLTYQRKFKKTVMKDKDIINLGLLKKKIIEKNVYYKIAYYALIILICVLLLIFNVKLLLLFMGFYIVFKIALYFLKRHLAAIFSALDKFRDWVGRGIGKMFIQKK